MQAILLAAGYGTRLRPITDSIPKCLVPIGGRPLLDYWLELLTRGGCTKILINLHYHSEKVISFIENSAYRDNVILEHEVELLGTGGTLLKNRGFIGGKSIIMVHADNLSRFDVLDFIQRHNNRPIDCEMTMMTFITQAPSSCGIVELDDRGVVEYFHEKVSNPPGNLANGAVYILEPAILDFISGLNKSKIDFSTEVLPNFLGRIFTYYNDDYHRDIGTLESYLCALNEYSQNEKD